MAVVAMGDFMKLAGVFISAFLFGGGLLIAFAQGETGSALAAKLKSNCERSGPGMGGYIDCQCVASKAPEYEQRQIAETSKQGVENLEKQKSFRLDQCAKQNKTAAECAAVGASFDTRIESTRNLSVVDSSLVMIAINKDNACKSPASMVKQVQMAACLKLPNPQPMYSTRTKEDYCGCYTDNLVTLHVGPPGTKVGTGALAGSTQTSAALACK